MPEETVTGEAKVTRREFLWYAWISSLALFMAGSAGATLAFAYPRFRQGEFGGKFVAGKVDSFADGSVTLFRDGKFFLSRKGDQFRALYQVCTHLGCLVRQTEEGFVCPCHGSRFAQDGTLEASPAARDMDQFAVVVVNGEVIVDTGTRSMGQNRHSLDL